MVYRPSSPSGKSVRSFRSVAFAESTASSQSSQYSKSSSKRGPKEHEIQKVINAMNMAVTQQQRKSSISAAVKKFNHRDKSKHNIELEMGGANALYQKLCLAISGNERGEKDQGEVAMICSAFEMVYRCSSANREKSFNSIGMELVTLLLRVVDLCEIGNIAKNDSDEIITDILSVFQYFSRVQNVSIPLTKTPGVLQVLALVVSSNSRPNSTRATAMSTLADLACAEANGALMARLPGLFDSVIDVAYLDSSNETREAAARALQNIIFSVEDSIPGIKFDKLVKALILLLKDNCEKTRKYAAGALQNLTTWQECQTRLVAYDGGAVVDGLLQMICSSDSDEARLRAIGAIINLVAEDTASTICTHDNLLSTFANLASSDKNSTIRQNAADTLCWLAEDMKSPRPGQRELLNTLVKVAQGRNLNSVAKAFYEQSQHSANREIMAKHPGILEALEKIAKKHNNDSNTVAKDTSVRALTNLARRGR